jgi:hypothetical protein
VWFRPDGPSEQSPGLRPQADALGNEAGSKCALKGRRSLSIPYISFVVLNFVTSEECPGFVLIRNAFMMFALIANILTDLFHSRLTHGK